MSRTTSNFAVRVHVDIETIVELSGELDLASAPLLQATVDHVPYQSIRRLLLDLEDLSFIDASGLRAVLALDATCRAHAVQLSIRHVGRSVQRVFDLTQMNLVVPFDPS